MWCVVLGLANGLFLKKGAFLNLSRSEERRVGKSV